MLKKLLLYLLGGVVWGCTCFVLFTCIGVVALGNTYLEPIMEHFIRQAAGYILIGICCVSASIVYTFRKLARWKQISIHFIIGMAGYLTVAYKLLKWMPVDNLGYCVIFVLIAVGIFIVIWACFYFSFKREAKKINTRLKELEREGAGQEDLKKGP